MKNKSTDIVRIWIASTAGALCLASASSLGKAEAAHADRLKQPGDRTRFLAARALLRHALCEAVDGEIPPEQWQYREGRYGKPAMAPGLPPLEFNLSHAGDCVSVAVGTSHPVGIDIESAVPDGRIEIVSDALNMGERAHLDRLPESEQWAIFLKFWTLKEACAKALGLGASLDFRQLEVTLDPLFIHSPSGLLGPDETFSVENSTIIIDRSTYCLSIAAISGAKGAVSFQFDPLTLGHGLINNRHSVWSGGFECW